MFFFTNPVWFFSIICSFAYSVFNEHLIPRVYSRELVGLDGLEPSTSRLSGARSNHLSYRPVLSGIALRVFGSYSSSPTGGDDGIRTHDPPACRAGALPAELHPPWCFPSLGPWKLNNKPSQMPLSLPISLVFFFLFLKFRNATTRVRFDVLHRKEVIQPHLPIRLPCYDLTPIIEPTFDCCLLAVSSQASGVPNFHGLTGGVYKARERIHRGMLIRDY